MNVDVSRRLPDDLICTRDPLGREIWLAERAEDDAAYFAPTQLSEIRAYYEEFGYVVVRDLVPAEFCREAIRLFEAEVKPYPGFIYRQTTANPERHQWTSTGFMLNPILNVQSLDDRHFAGFRRAGLDVIAHARTQSVVAALLGEGGKLVQSMYFEGNPATWPHQDSYYLDSETIGRMTAGWFAIEDIAPGAGRFFIYPGSHKIDMARNGGNFDVAFHHDRYKKLVRDVILQRGLKCRAPALRAGDALFWAAKTIHGSLDTTQPNRSRSSFTAHYIPNSQRFLQYQKRIMTLKLAPVNGMPVHHPKNLNQPGPRAVFWVETNFPKSFQLAKKLAIKALIG